MCAGDDGSGPDANSGVLIKESDHSYVMWCSGRIGVEGMLVQLRMVKRQDLINFLQRMVKPVCDQIVSIYRVYYVGWICYKIYGDGMQSKSCITPIILVSICSCSFPERLVRVRLWFVTLLVKACIYDTSLYRMINICKLYISKAFGFESVSAHKVCERYICVLAYDKQWCILDWTYTFLFVLN